MQIILRTGLLLLSLIAGSAEVHAQERVVVFVPGIMGSKLTVDGKPVWGQGANDEPELEYLPGQTVVAEPLDSFTVERLFRTQRVIYGDLLTEMNSNLSAPSRFLPFAYDWRAGNARSAKSLHEYLCSINSTAGGIVLVGHSMGGLVIKHWISEYFYNTCADGSLVRVDEVVFAATPHFGSPQAVKSLLSDVVLHPHLNWLVAGGINRLGFSFDSIYELLPAIHASEEDGTPCIAEQKDTSLAPAAVFFDGSTDDAKPVDLFSAATYIDLGILDRFPRLKELPDARAFLQDKLDRARRSICKIAKFEMPASLLGHVHFVAGFGEMNNSQRPRDTVKQLTFFNNGAGVEVEESFGESKKGLVTVWGIGDGTVPLPIALNGASEFAQTPDFSTYTIRADHQAILNSSQFKGLVNFLRSGAPTQISLAKARSLEGIAAIVGRQSLAAYVDREKIVSELVKNPVWSQTSSALKYSYAKERSDPVLLESLGQDSALPAVYQAWALQNAAFYYSSKNLSVDALRASLAAEKIAITLPEDKQTQILPSIYNTRGSLFWESGSPTEATAAFTKALEVDPQMTLALQGLERIKTTLDAAQSR